jgi:tetratricopeptide (TPR) repeat protein
VSGVLALAIAGMVREDQHTEAPYFTGLSLLAQGNYRQAIPEFTAAIAADPSDGFPYLRRALAYESVGNTPAAIADYRRALATAQDEDTKKKIHAAIGRLTAKQDEQRRAAAQRAAKAAQRAAQPVPRPPAPLSPDSTTVTAILVVWGLRGQQNLVPMRTMADCERAALERRAADNQVAEAFCRPAEPEEQKIYSSKPTTLTIIRNMKKREEDDTCVPCVERWWERDIKGRRPW